MKLLRIDPGEGVAIRHRPHDLLARKSDGSAKAVMFHNMFYNCYNLRYVKGMSEFYDPSVSYMMTDYALGCNTDTKSSSYKEAVLEKSDLCIAANLTSNNCVYAKMTSRNLVMDVLDVFPKNGFDFSHSQPCGWFLHDVPPALKKIYCSDFEKLGEILWNNPNASMFTSTGNAFKNFSDDFRSHVPVSWGGTM